MTKIITYILSFVTLLGFVGCHAEVDDMPDVANDNYIKLYFAPYGDTRGTIADNECESYLSHLDIVIYKHNVGDSYEGFYHERVSVSDTPDGVTTIHRTKEDFEQGAYYKIYVIANSNVEESVSITQAISSATATSSNSTRQITKYTSLASTLASHTLNIHRCSLWMVWRIWAAQSQRRVAAWLSTTAQQMM